MATSAVTLHLYPDHTGRSRQARLFKAAADFAAALGCPCPDLTLAQGEFGKPYFPASPWLHFSISHSGGYWLLGLSLTALGLDIQEKRPADYLALARRWFKPAEAANVAQGGAEAFYEVWCAREAYLKLIGCGLSQADKAESLVRDGQLCHCLGSAALLFPCLVSGYAACVAGEIGPLDIIRHDV